MLLLAVVGLIACGASPAPEPISTTPSVASAPTVATTAPAPSAAVAPAPVASSAPPPEPPKAEPIVPGEPLGSPLSNAPTTSTGPSGNNAAAAVAAVRPKLKACYQKVKGNGPDIAGMVSCGLRVTKEGKVASISVTRRDRLPNPLVECIVKELKTATFGPMEEEVVIQVPVRFALPAE